MTTKPKRPRDMNQLAKLIVDMTVGEAPPDIEQDKKQTVAPVKKKDAKSEKSAPAKRKNV